MSKENGSAVSAVGLSVGAGSRHGAGGEALLLKHLAFKGTAAQSDIAQCRAIEAAGLSVGADAGREAVLYKASGPAGSGAAALEVVAEAATSPKLTGWHLEEVVKESVSVELGLAAKDAQSLLVETLHAAAFGEASPLGRTIYAANPAAFLGGLGAHHAGLFVPSNMAVLGAGVAHGDLVAQAEALFVGGAAGGAAPVAVASPYVGGCSGLKAASPLTHVAVALPGASTGAPDYFTALVAQELLSGSSGEAMQAFSLSYADAGLFGLYGCSDPAGAGALAEAMVGALTGAFSEDQVAAAKLAVKTRLLVGAADSAALVASLAGVGAAAKPAGAVDAVTGPAVKAFLAKAAKGAAPTLATVGPAAAVPDYATFAKMF